MAITPLQPENPQLTQLLGLKDLMPTQQQSDIAAGPPPASISFPGIEPLPQLPGSSLQPLVTSPRRMQEDSLQQKISSYENPAPKPGGFWHRLGQIAAATGNIAGDIALGGQTMAEIPGTWANRSMRHAQNIGELAGLQKQDIEEQDAISRRALQEAQTAEARERTAEMPGEAQQRQELQDAQIQNLLHPQAKTDFEAWRQQNPGKPVEDWLKSQAQAKSDVKQFTPEQEAYDKAFKELTSKGLSPSQAVEKLKEKPPTVNLQAGNARADRSYQFNQTELDKVSKPISDTITRMGRLKDTIAQGNMQADALIAPELLSVMAGGSGSGLRMNEAEIARIVGGRTKWESLKADINKWNLDPKEARSITPEQQKQIESLVNAVHGKLLKKQSIIDNASNSLVSSEDPLEHRKIVSQARQALTKIDEGESSPVSGKGVSLKAAMALPFNKGKTEDQVRKDIESHGHKVVD